MDVYSMTDEELATQLRSLGEDIGPVIDSTRKVYQRKLERLLRGLRGRFADDVHYRGRGEETKKKDGAPVDSRSLLRKPLTPKIMDVYSMTDEELAAQLRSLGEDIGPVIDSTRKVYQRKLERLLRGEVWKQPVFDDGDGDYEEEEDDIIDGPEIIPPAQHLRGRFADDVHYRGRGEETKKKEPYNTTFLGQPAPSTQQVPATSTTSSSAQQEKPKGGSSIWIQVCILGVVAAVIFLILMNLEPAGQGRIGDIHGE